MTEIEILTERIKLRLIELSDLNSIHEFIMTFIKHLIKIFAMILKNKYFLLVNFFS